MVNPMLPGTPHFLPSSAEEPAKLPIQVHSFEKAKELFLQLQRQQPLEGEAKTERFFELFSEGRITIDPSEYGAYDELVDKIFPKAAPEECIAVMQREGYHRYRTELFKNYHFVPIAGDGNCLFSAVGHALSIADPGAIRQQANEEIEKNRGSYAAFLPDGVQSHLQKMQKEGVWGGEVELRALAKAYGCQILVFNPAVPRRDEEGHILPSTSYGVPENEQKVYLLFNGVDHYDALELTP